MNPHAAVPASTSTASALCRAVLETLEGRRLLAFNGPNFDLPFVNDFSVERNGIEDQDGQTTGFPIVQGNSSADEYQPDLIDLDLDDGFLLLTSRGNAANGGNFGSDNTLANGLQLPFDAVAGAWTLHTRISDFNAPLTQFDTAFEQAGILFGPTQDNFVKLVFGHDGSNVVVQFVAETNLDGTFNYPGGQDGFKSIVTGVQGVNLATADYVDLWLSGDPSTGTISAQYRVEGGQTIRFNETFQFDGALRETFFRQRESRGGVMVQHRNDGDPITAAFDEFGVEREGLPSNRPAVEEARPGPGETDVDRDAFVAVDLALPNAGIDESTLTSGNVRLVRVSDGQQVEAKINTTGGGDAIILQPVRILDAETQYRFEITSGVTDLFGVTAQPYSETFTTGFGISQSGGDVAFDQVALPGTQGTLWTSVTIGPDNKLYATTVDGRIVRWNINANGTLGSAQTITSVVDAEGADRVMTGLAFHPDSTAQNLIAYVTHTDFNDVTTDQPDELGQDFSGKVTRVAGANLQTVQDVVVGLPRSIRDHLTNQPSFGPGGLLYVPQGANTAMGEPDSAWGFRNEHLLNAAILAVDVDAIGSGTVDVHTEDEDPYNPFAANAPVTIYASGIRNAYDMVWHSNGRLYVPTNGSAAGGNTPQSPQPGSAEFGDDRIDLEENGPFTGDFIPGLNNVPQTQNDYLFRVEEGGYYGHPNPTRDEWVLNGGNPTGGIDQAEVTAYPTGTRPDRNYRGFVFDFEKNKSPNGVIEYDADVFGGSLNNKLIVARYSGGDDLVAIQLNSSGNVVEVEEGIAGFTGFDDPLDIVQRENGQMYVVEFGDMEITLLRPVESGGKAKVEKRRAFTNSFPGTPGDPASFTIRNTGNAPLLLSSYTLTLTGEDREHFDITGNPVTAVAVPPGATHTYDVVFNAPSGAQAGEVFSAAVSVRTNDPDAPEVTTKLFGLVTSGVEGANEPSLQRILDLYGFGVDTGDDDPSNNDIVPGGDIVAASLFRQADPAQAVTVVPIASFGPDADPAATIGFYEAGRPGDLQQLQRILGVQTIDPVFHGGVKFDPSAVTGSDTFGLYMQTPTFLDGGRARTIYSQDQLNTWEPVSAERRKVFTWPLTLADGTPVEDSYIVAFEEFANDTDGNDVVLIVRNVEVVAESGPRLQLVSPFVMPYTDRLVFSTIDDAGREPGQLTRDSMPVTIRNIGNGNIDITGASATGLFSVSGFAPATLAPGQDTTFNVNFDADAGDLASGELGKVLTGTLSVTDSSAGLADMAVDLVGHVQRYTEDGIPVGLPPPNINAEPTLDTLLAMFGYQVDAGTPAERNNKGIIEAVGDEVLSPFWQATGSDLPVEVHQIVAYHQVPTEDFLAWYDVQAPGTRFEVVRNEGNWSQSVLPAINNGSGPVVGAFEPGDATFGIRVSGEDSDPADNFVGPDDQGHHVRFFPLRDLDGNFVEDTWLMMMDFVGFNFDYNDNVYILRNMRPASNDAGEAPPPTGLSAFRRNGEVVLDWGRLPGIDGFAVYRSSGSPDNFQKLHSGSLFADYFHDEDPPSGEVYYRVHSIGDGSLAMFSEVRVV